MVNTMSQGTVIQAFGRYFAGMIDMNMERWYKIHPDYANEPFKITGVSPFSIIGKADPSLQKYAESERTNPRVKADIKKNFDKICEKSYCDYFLLDNSAALIGLTQINNQFYSLMGGEKTDFTDDYFNNNNEVKNNYIKPANEGFSDRLKKQYDLFIEAVLRHYDPERIILIRSHMPRFYSDNGNIAKTKHTKKAGFLIKQLDDYFTEETNCMILDTPTCFFETKENTADAPFTGGQEDLRIALERAVISKIENTSDNTSRGKTETESISDYIADGGNDLKFIADYFESKNFTFEDITALFWLYEETKNNWFTKYSKKTTYPNIFNIILSKKNSLPYLYTKEFFERNVKKLRGYENCFIDTDKCDYNDKIIVRIDAKHFLEINDNDGLFAFNICNNQKWDYNKFIENNYTCDITEIDDALESWETYFERGRRKCSEPFILKFNSMEEFEHSLYFVDYEDILSNENYIVALPDNGEKAAEYKPKVDASFLFDDKTRVFNLRSGFADQRNNYIYARKLCGENAFSLYFDDLLFNNISHHNGLEIHRITQENIEPILFTNLFSKKLQRIIRNMPGKSINPVEHSSLWKQFGLHEGYLVAYINSVLHKIWESHVVQMPIMCSKNIKHFEYFAVNKIENKIPVICLANADAWGFSHKKFLENIFVLPAPQKIISKSNQFNIQTAEKMRSQYPISLHIRLGDSVGLWYRPSTDNKDQYKKAMDFVWNGKDFKKYNNKHLYIFSDDMDFVREHYKELGLDLAGENITYVDWNHHYNSIYDLHLMSLSKVIMRAIGGFALTAAYISKNVEYVVQASPDTVKIEWQRENM